ncbi:esterase/lipase family protein [Blastococcus sp. SYSU D00813]
MDSTRRRSLLAATEPIRALASAGVLAATSPLLAVAPRGDRHPVLVLPGLLASDVSTTALRGWVRALGYPVVGWELGRNRGPTPAVVEALPGLVQRLADRHGGAVSIVGQSLGGVFARRLAQRTPALVRSVVTLGSPFRLVGRPDDDSPGARAYRRFAPLHTSRRLSTADPARPLPVPSTSVYSRWDGVVDWRACLQRPGPRSENVGVHAGHLAMGHDPAVLWVVADRLAQPAGDWRPFRPPPGLARLFPGGPQEG